MSLFISMTDQKRCILILSVSSDIGRELALRYLRDGCTVVGTYRSAKYVEELRSRENMHLFECDIDDAVSVDHFAKNLESSGLRWNTFISSVSTQLPLGRFFRCNFDEWTKGFGTNCLNQLGFLHRIYAFRTQPMAHVMFFAGPGTNNAARNYSSVCLAKIALIKMCELLDDENEDLNVFIVGPGWVRTKTHEDTLKNPALTEDGFVKTKQFMDSGLQGTPMEEIYRHTEWLVAQGRDVAGGRNSSTVHDAWGSEELAKEMRNDRNMYKLRRHRNDWKERGAK